MPTKSRVTEATAKHTAGPWRVGEMCGGTIHIEADTTPRHVTVGRVHVFGIHAEAEANARLIAAAPDLLQAAKDLDRMYHDIDWQMSEERRFNENTGGNYTALAHYHDQLNAAIAKAEGRS